MSSPPNFGERLDPEKHSLSDHGSSVTQFADIHAGPTSQYGKGTPSNPSTPNNDDPTNDHDEDEIESDTHRNHRINAGLTTIARQISNTHRASSSHGDDNNDLHPTRTTSTLGALAGANPFEDPSHPELNPADPAFDPRKWVKLIMRQHARHEDAEGAGGTLNFDALRAGVSFRNLSVHGFGRPTDFQKDVGNIWLEVVQGVKSVFGRGEKTKIQILKDFEGVVRAGEMLVVLGRPGSGCSTFLKTVAGETHGFWVGEGSEINYQGIEREVMHGNFRGEVIYQAETDGEFPALSVGL